MGHPQLCLVTLPRLCSCHTLNFINETCLPSGAVWCGLLGDQGQVQGSCQPVCGPAYVTGSQRRCPSSEVGTGRQWAAEPLPWLTRAAPPGRHTDKSFPLIEVTCDAQASDCQQPAPIPPDLMLFLRAWSLHQQHQCPLRAHRNACLHAHPTCQGSEDGAQETH